MMRSMARSSARLLGNAYDPHPSPILPLQAAPTHDALGCEAPGTWDGPHTGGVEMSGRTFWLLLRVLPDALGYAALMALLLFGLLFAWV